MSNRSYDREFKINAIKLYREGSKSLNKVAKDLGIPFSTLATWVKEYEKQGENSFPGSGKIKPCNEEMYLLRKELASVRQERDILKKAIAIFSTQKKGN